MQNLLLDKESVLFIKYLAIISHKDSFYCRASEMALDCVGKVCRQHDIVKGATNMGGGNEINSSADRTPRPVDLCRVSYSSCDATS
jgi:hypothetical protein